MDNNQNNFNNDMNNYNQVQPQMNEQSQMNPQMNVPPVNQPMSEPVVEEKKKSMLPIIIIAIVVILVAAVVLYFTLGKKSETPSGGGEEAPTDTPSEVKPSTNINGYNCTFDGELTDGAEYINGQYKYTYHLAYYYQMKHNFNGYEPIDGWKIELVNPDSIDPITTKPCTYIENKYVIDMSDLFANTSFTSIDLSGFDTSNVFFMNSMFRSSSVTSLDLSGFDTSKVVDMGSMFEACKSLNSLDLRSFNTSNVNRYGSSGLFYGCTKLETIIASKAKWTLGEVIDDHAITLQ